ncbi:MAG TPA: mycothiol synthase [Nocardioides sp.]|uniref:mycothiol synthase n=1 Tax=Nocardioides sp. TaxID=35761 RepID=UPI002C5C1EB7|nr:mycothiol synthase [Nocardioides sp.]HQR28432.1 mycothiol synthase [Nocardioides sp.]
MRAACLAAGEPDPLDEAAELALKHAGLSTTTRLWLQGDDGFALVVDGVLALAVEPTARRAGLGTALAREAVASGLVRSAWSHNDHPGAAALAARFGFTRARELWVMRRPSTLPLPPVVVPAGVALRTFRPGDEGALLAVNAAAFAHHPEQGAMDAADLAARMAEPWFDPAGLLLAVAEDGTLLGFHWTKRVSATVGEVYVLGLAPAAQGRGLGTVLTLAGLHHLLDPPPGVSEVELYVESDNAPAIALYSRLGFTHSPADTHVRYSG